MMRGQTVTQLPDDDDVENNSDALIAITNVARALRDDAMEIQNLEERLSEAKARQIKRKHETLPTMMDDLGLSSLTVAAENNMPSVEIRVRPFYAANIAANWPGDKRQKAFDALEEVGASDLIKTSLLIKMPRERHEIATGMRELIVKTIKKKWPKYNFDVDVVESVHHMVLTAWLRERTEANVKGAELPIPPLETIGGYIGREAVVVGKIK